MALTDAVVRNSKPQTKPYTLKDIQGLSLYISPTGNKAWHYRYTLEGKRNRVSLGQDHRLSSPVMIASQNLAPHIEALRLHAGVFILFPLGNRIENLLGFS